MGESPQLPIVALTTPGLPAFMSTLRVLYVPAAYTKRSYRYTPDSLWPAIAVRLPANPMSTQRQKSTTSSYATMPRTSSRQGQVSG